jgi:hypothetical protein
MPDKMVIEVAHRFQGKRCMNIEIQKGKTTGSDSEKDPGKSSFLVAVPCKTPVIQKSVHRQYHNRKGIKERKAGQES